LIICKFVCYFCFFRSDYVPYRSNVSRPSLKESAHSKMSILRQDMDLENPFKKRKHGGMEGTSRVLEKGKMNSKGEWTTLYFFLR